MLKKAVVTFIICISLSLVINAAEPNNLAKAKAHYNLSLYLYKQNNISETIEELKKAIKYNDSNYIYFFNLATVYLEQKMYDKAIDYFLKTLKLNNTYQPAYYNLGLCYFYKNNFIDAVDYFKEAVALNQYDIDAHLNLGLAYKNLKKYDLAEIENQKVLMVEPENIAAMVNLAVVYKNKGDLKKSADLFQKVLLRDPDNKVALYNLSILKSRKKQEKEYTVSSTGKTIKQKIEINNVSPITGEKVTSPLSYLSEEDKQDFVVSQKQEGNVKPTYKDEVELNKQLQDSYELIEKRIMGNKQTDKVETQQYDNLDEFKQTLIKSISNNVKQQLTVAVTEINNRLDKMDERITVLENNKKTDTLNDFKINEFDFDTEFQMNNEPVSNINEFDIPEIDDMSSSVQGFEPVEIQPLPDMDFEFNSSDEIVVQDLSLDSSLDNVADINGQININSDDKETLVSSGINNELAENIIWFRKNIGQFSSKEDVLGLPGMTLELYNKIINNIIY